MAEVIILSGRALDFEDDKGKKVQGLSIQYIFGLEPQEDRQSGIYGQDIFKAFLPINAVNKLVSVPGKYETKSIMTRGRNGSPQERVTDIEFKTEI